MRHTRHVLSSLLAIAGILIHLAARPTSADDMGGCDLQFLPGSAPTINGIISGNEWGDAGILKSGTCIDSLQDGPTLNTLTPHQVLVYSKRDAGNHFLYLAFDVADDTANGIIGDTITVLFDASHHKGPNPVFYRLDYTVPRPGTPEILFWYKGSFSAMNGMTWTQVPGDPRTANPDFKVVGQEHPAPDIPKGYVVEMQIPFTSAAPDLSIGYNPGATFPDIGIALVVTDDNGFTDQGLEALTGVGFPNTTDLALTNPNSPIINPDLGETEPTSNWNNPKFWGTGFLVGSGDSIYIDRVPNAWTSDDIKVGLCTAASFADAGNPSTANPKWYVYNPNAPCPLLLFERIHRSAGVGTVRKRVLSLWAEGGANPQKWHYMNLTDPLDLGPVTNATVDVLTPPFSWASNQVPINLNLQIHPCIRAFILPAELNLPGLDETFFKGIGSEATPQESAAKITQFMQGYSIPNAQWAQMNIELLTTFTCPSPCPPLPQPPRPPGRPGEPRVAVRETPPQLEPVAAPAPPEAGLRPDGRPRTAVVVRPPERARDVIVDFTAFGITQARGRRKYTFIEPLGGVQKVVNVPYLNEKRVLPLAFNVSNSFDYPRRIVVSSRMTLPPDTKEIGLRLASFEEDFASGQTRLIRAEVGPGVTPTPGPGPGPNPTPERGWDGIFAILILILTLILILIVLVLIVLKRLK